MSYPLKYFVEYIDKYNRNKNVETFDVYPEVYDYFNDREVVCKTMEVVDHIRSLKYGRSDYNETINYLKRLLKEIIKLKLEIERLGNDIKIDLVQFNNPKRDYIVYENLFKIYEELIEIIKHLIDFDDSLIQVINSSDLIDRFHVIPPSCIYSDHIRIVEYILSNCRKNEDVVKKYGLYNLEYWNEIHFETIIDFYKEDKATNVRYLTRKIFENSDHTLLSYFKRYVRLYLNNSDIQKRKSYVLLMRQLREMLVPVVSFDGLIERIVNIFVYNNVCHELVLEFINLKLEELSKTFTRQEFANYISKQVEKLNGVFDADGFSCLEVSLEYREDEGESLINKHLHLFEEKIKMNELQIHAQETLNNEDVNKVDKLYFNGTGECIGILFDLFFQVNLFFSEKKKSKASRVLSQNVLFSPNMTNELTTCKKNDWNCSDMKEVEDKTIYAAFWKDGRKSEDNNMIYIKNKLVDMIKLIDEMGIIKKK